MITYCQAFMQAANIEPLRILPSKEWMGMPTRVYARRRAL
jgi:hypothetical protein